MNEWMSFSMVNPPRNCPLRSSQRRKNIQAAPREGAWSSEPPNAHCGVERWRDLHNTMMGCCDPAGGWLVDDRAAGTGTSPVPFGNAEARQASLGKHHLAVRSSGEGEVSTLYGYLYTYLIGYRNTVR